jgi:hypothetical protein
LDIGRGGGGDPGAGEAIGMLPVEGTMDGRGMWSVFTLAGDSFAIENNHE